MKVVSDHGFMMFYPSFDRELTLVEDRFDLGLVQFRDGYTFEKLRDLKHWSLATLAYDVAIPTETYSGHDAAEVFRENGFVYNIQTNTVMLAAAVLNVVEILRADAYWVVDGICALQPGSVTTSGQKIISYVGEYTVAEDRLLLFDWSAS